MSDVVMYDPEQLICGHILPAQMLGQVRRCPNMEPVRGGYRYHFVGGYLSTHTRTVDAMLFLPDGDWLSITLDFCAPAMFSITLRGMRKENTRIIAWEDPEYVRRMYRVDGGMQAHMVDSYWMHLIAIPLNATVRAGG